MQVWKDILGKPGGQAGGPGRTESREDFDVIKGMAVRIVRIDFTCYFIWVIV
ncbi:hypothetical protein D3C76_1486300 [compost metagenome]